MAVDTNLEREYKFDVDPGFEPPDLRPVVGRTERLPEQRLVSTYYDTADHRLWAAGITLRHRRENPDGASPDGKWTLKLPQPATGSDGASVRTELNWPGPAGEIPAGAAAVVAGIIRREPLVPLAILSSVRQRMLLHDGATGGPWAEMDDDTVTVSGGPKEGFRFRQVEIELLSEPPAGRTLDDILDRLGRAGGVPGGGSKVGMAAGLDDPVPADGNGGLPAVIAAVIRQDLGRLLDADWRLRVPSDATDPGSLEVEAVHDARTATRRLRSDLKTFSAHLDPVWYGHVAPALKHLGRLLGRLRDEDVLVERVTRHAGDHLAAQELIALIRADRHLGAGELLDHLGSPAYFETLDRVHAAAARPPLVGPSLDGDPAETLTGAVADRWRQVAEGIDGLPAEPTAAQLHQVRIRAKRLRYAAEAAATVAGRPATRTARRARRLQAVLGEVNDATEAARELSRLGSHPSLPGAVAFEAGRIAGLAEAEAQAARRRWQKAAEKVRRAPAKRWRH